MQDLTPSDSSRMAFGPLCTKLFIQARLLYPGTANRAYLHTLMAHGEPGIAWVLPGWSWHRE